MLTNKVVFTEDDIPLQLEVWKTGRDGRAPEFLYRKGLEQEAVKKRNLGDLLTVPASPLRLHTLHLLVYWAASWVLSGKQLQLMELMMKPLYPSHPLASPWRVKEDVKSQSREILRNDGNLSMCLLWYESPKPLWSCLGSGKLPHIGRSEPLLEWSKQIPPYPSSECFTLFISYVGLEKDELYFWRNTTINGTKIKHYTRKYCETYHPSPSLFVILLHCHQRIWTFLRSFIVVFCAV